VLVAMYGVLGIANTVYHPADYTLLSRHVAPERISHAYSVHTFAGMLGSAAAPGGILFLHGLFGWRGALLGTAVFGSIVALVLLLQPDGEPVRAQAKPRDDAKNDTSWRLLLAPPILMSCIFFFMLAFAGYGLQNFLVVALGSLYGTSPVVANAALSGNLVLSALGVLIGGWIAGRITHFRLFSAFGLGVTAITAVLIGSVDLGTLLLIAAMSFAGLCAGMVMPSRDMIVRGVTPPGAFGKVFGFVTNGFNVAGIIAPLLFGALLDHGEPRAMFYIIAAFTVLSIIAVASVSKQRGA
jgi:MFS transporter, FSR family, fosmidomycin resistance protein